ncbi:DNA-binding protein [Propioniferax innocua]|nr:DNA-binding protein [Propioniferax innocua]
MDANMGSQRRLYGEPVSDIVARIVRFLGMNQSQIARGIGLSAPMLSHLVAGRRVKIGNPHALARLRGLNDLALGVESGVVPPAEVEVRVAEVVDAHYEWNEQTTRQLRRRPDKRDEEAAVHDVQALFRSVASAEEWLEVVASLRVSHPRVAELLHAYGIARSDEALAHWMKVLG